MTRLQKFALGAVVIGLLTAAYSSYAIDNKWTRHVRTDMTHKMETGEVTPTEGEAFLDDQLRRRDERERMVTPIFWIALAFAGVGGIFLARSMRGPPSPAPPKEWSAPARRELSSTSS